jgi:small subunit ribosomal protein S27Ae
MSEKVALKKKKEKPVSAYYKLEKNGLVRILPTCDRCGAGYFMADHGNRYSCGHCGFTRFKTDGAKKE